MKILDLLFEGTDSKHTFVDMFKKFLPLAMKVLELDSLPQFSFHASINTGDQPSFGAYRPEDKTMYIALENRHPVDILRTIAHELVHFKQDLMDHLNPDSGETGSPEENQAHELAGIIMRHFNLHYPKYLSSKPIS